MPYYKEHERRQPPCRDKTNNIHAEKAGIIETQNGSSGGKLLRPQEEITLRDIYQAVNNSDKKACINCMRCVSVYPHNARAANGAMVKMVKMVEIDLKKTCSDRKNNKLYI